jgi:PAS domain S-box-containing protein
VESANDAIIVSDHHGYIVSWNKAASQMFGYTMQEVIDRPLTVLMPMRYREGHERGMERMRMTGVSNVIGHTVELHGLHVDGHEFPIELSLASWRTQEGAFYSGIVRDISERKRAEKAIEEGRNRLNVALRAGRLGTWEWHPRTGAVVWSDHAEEIFGLPPKSLKPTFDAFLGLIHVDDCARIAKDMLDAAITGRPYIDDFRIVWPDGSVRWVAATGQIYRAEQQDLFRMIGTVQCITKQKEAELALRESQVLLHQLIEHIAEVFWMTDPEKTQMLYISPGYEKVWGRSCASLKASPRSWVEAIHPDDRKRVLGEAMTKQASGQYDVEYRIVRPDGTVRWIWDRAFPIRDADGQVYRIAGLAEDVTEQRERMSL